jgi:PAS domain S-box-containing protein
MRIQFYLRTALQIIVLSAIWLGLHFFLASRPEYRPYLLPLSIFSLLLLLLPVLYWTIEKPLLQIKRALDKGDTAPIEKLRSQKTIFGTLADLIVRSFEQNARLTTEINERKKAEDKLAEREKQYRDLFETAPDAIICTAEDSTIILHNLQAARMFGSTEPTGICGKTMTSFLSESGNDGFTAALHRGGQRDIYTFECGMKRIDGSVFTAEIYYLPGSPTDEKNAMLFYIRDISDRKIAENDKKKLEEQFLTMYKLEAIGQLAGGIAHDYNNILGAISGYADLIRHRYPDDDRLKKYATMILSASRRASELTKKLLIFARKNKLNLTDFDAHEALLEVVDLLNHSIDKSITIICQPKATRYFIYGDPVQYQNALMNIALNARDAMPKGGMLTFRTGVSEIDRSFPYRREFTVAPGSYFTLAVTDTGSGMDDATLAHLFEPFFTTKDIGQGTGLGLASVYGTMKSHNGFIDVKSAVDSGTTFTLYFPLVEHSMPAAATLSVPLQPGKGHIMFVDDENFLRDAVREMLSILGYTVSICSNGAEALSLFTHEPDSFDLVILDMRMPGMTGLECFKRMKAAKPDVRALLSTGYSLDEERQGMLDEGILGVIQKPYISTQLAQAVNDALQARR